MKQVAVFSIPSQIKEANEFLAKNPPEQVSVVGLIFKKLVVNYDDQSYPPSYVIEELMALILSNRKQIMTSEIALEVTHHDLSIAERELSELEATSIPTDIDPKKAYDLKKDREDKIDAYKKKIAALEEAAKNLEESIRMHNTRNSIMQRMIDRRV